MKDNRPPKEERTLKCGDIGKGGRVFWGYCAAAKDGEYWMTQDKFNKMSATRKKTRASLYERDKDERRVRAAEKYERNKDEIKAKAKERYERNKDERLAKAKERYERNKDEIRARAKEGYTPVIRKLEIGSDEWLRHKSAVRSRWNKKKRLTDISFRIKDNMRRRLNIAIRDSSKAGRTMDLAGCSIDDLKEHLESKFADGMSWDNYGLYGWHIDHIKPCAAFDLTLDSEQRECFNYSNLQPLWAEDNLRKSDKYHG